MRGQDAPADGPTFGDLLRRHRRDRALTQEGLAAGAGVSARAISDLERGARAFPYRETANRLADALALDRGDRATLLAAAQRRRSSAGREARRSPERRLPQPLSPLIGRTAECDEITRLVREQRARLLTLTGPAGVGKTRLAVAAAERLSDAFRDGVVFVDLAPATSDQVLPAIATALGLSDQGAIPLAESVRRRLSSRQLLLVLDNFEHVLAAAPLVSALLQGAPGVQALTTSRAALLLHGERDYPVAPLPTPEPGTAASPAALADWAAIQLFVERAGQSRSGFRLTPENAAAVVALCQRLDGLPLAIELAAARSSLLTPETLLARLDQRFALLTAGMRDAPPRQRTLGAAIAWSYDLLPPHQQTLFRMLAVFTGGWTLEAAEMVGRRCGVPDVLDALAALVEQNLVVRDDGGPMPRYRLLETIRAFASAQLLTSGEEEHARRAHLAYVIQLARENDLERLDAGPGARLACLQADEINVRMGIEWGIAHDPESAVAVLAALGYFWYLTGRNAVGLDLLTRALATGAGANERARALALQQAAWLGAIFGDYAQAEHYADAACALAQQLGDAQTVAHAQICQGAILVSRGAVARGTSLLETALTYFESVGDFWGASRCLSELGQAAYVRGDLPTYLSCFERIRAIGVAHDLPARYHAQYLDNLAIGYNQRGQHDAAMEACVAALRYAVEAGDVAVEHTTLALLLLDRGETAQAVLLGADIAESLGFFWETGDKWHLIQGLEIAAALMAAGRQPEPAARALGAAAALRQALPYPIPVGERAAMDRLLAECTTALGEPVFTQAWTAGQAQSLSTTVHQARAVLATLAAP